MKKVTLLLLVLLAGVSGYAQSASIQGTILDNENNPLEFANVLLLQASDSTLIRGAVTNEEGFYAIERVEMGNYLISASIIGYTDSYSTPFQLSNDDIKIDPLIFKKESSTKFK